MHPNRELIHRYIEENPYRAGPAVFVLPVTVSPSGRSSAISKQ